MEELTPTGLTMDQADRGVLEIVANMTRSDDHGERVLGNILNASIYFAADEEKVDILRCFSSDLRMALDTFDKRWLHLVGE